MSRANFRVFNENRRTLSVRAVMPPSKPVVRAYDGAEVFREDSLIRIRKLETEIVRRLKRKISGKGNALPVKL